MQRLAAEVVRRECSLPTCSRNLECWILLQPQPAHQKARIALINCFSFAHSLTLHGLSLALSPALGPATTDSTARRPRPQTPASSPPPSPFRCEAYSDKGKCQYNRCVQQTRGSYLSRDGWDAQMMSFSLGGDPSELLLPIGQRWSWRTSRSVKGAVPVRHSRLT